jgi:hypothetical protein
LIKISKEQMKPFIMPEITEKPEFKEEWSFYKL